MDQPNLWFNFLYLDTLETKNMNFKGMNEVSIHGSYIFGINKIVNIQTEEDWIQERPGRRPNQRPER